jgi:hypothetical protein
MTKTVDVAAGQKVASTWGNEIRDRTRQVFASVTERDAQWTTAPNGAECVTLDTGTTWYRLAGAWVNVNADRSGMVVPTTDAAGEVIINFAPQFPTTLASVVACIGFYSGFTLNVASPGAGANNVGFKARVYLNAAAAANTVVGINYVAKGA